MQIIFDNNGKIVDLLQHEQQSINGINNLEIISIQHPADNYPSQIADPDYILKSGEQFFENWKTQLINQNISVLEDETQKVKNALYNLRYNQINNKTQKLIYSGIDYTYKGETVHFYFDQFNQLEFTALRIKADANELTYPYKVWEGNNSLEFAIKADLIAFLNTVFDFIQNKKIEGKNLRDSLLVKTISELVNFVDPRN